MTMTYMSQLIGKTVTDLDGDRVGRLDDLVVTTGSQVHPVVSALVIKGRSAKPLLVPIADVAVLVAPAIPLKKRKASITPYIPNEHDLFLSRDILDKQIIDINGMRVVRVNDLDLAWVNGNFYIANVDVGGMGLMRRLGLAGPTEKVAGRLGKAPAGGVIPWDSVELLPGNQPLRLKVPGDKISELHPADLAEIISDLSRAESSKFLETLDLETAADTLEEVEPEFQASLIEGMSDERVADLLEEMAPDEAADLLAELSEERSQELLNLMELEDAQDVRKLLAYPEDSAGGIMTTEYIAVPTGLSAEQALAYIRENAEDAETIFYVYVTAPDGQLAGVFSLQDLVLAKPQTPVEDFMHHRLVTVDPGASQEDVAEVVAKYNLLAVPVVDEDGRLQGIVTADDALDKLIPTAWKKRLPRMYR
jgi:magnesium transporter